jgi:hypothetical protein
MRCFCPLPYYTINEEKGKNMGERKSVTAENFINTLFLEPHTRCYMMYQ